MSTKSLAILFFFLSSLFNCKAQTDSVFQQLQKINTQYFSLIDKKMTLYSNRVNDKTEKTLVKLSRWEKKIQSLLQKVDPEAAELLFSSNQLTFTAALQQFKAGKSVIETYKAGYDEYMDNLNMQIKFLVADKDQLDKKDLLRITNSEKKMSRIQEDVQSIEAMQCFIDERKKKLVKLSLQHLSKNKYVQKINKESFYYVESLRNYKEIFSDERKIEETAINFLNKIPAFKKFVNENSLLASLFRLPDNYGTDQSLLGLQTRGFVNTLIQDRITSGGPNARDAMQQNIEQAQAELTKLKDKIINAGVGGSDAELPDFKPNMQKTKTFKQRLEYGFNFQPMKNNSLNTSTADVGLSIGYNINDKSVAGIGASYKLGLGNIKKIRFTHEGIGLRSFMDWKLKKQFFVSGGFEINHNASFKNLAALREYDVWQQSGLLGISKKVEFKSKLMKGGKLQLLHDFLYRQHLPVSQPVVFRMGYNF